MIYRRLLGNTILANLTFVLVVALGVAAYLGLPRQQDPSVDFNWVEIHTRFPGASARDVEERVTDILEQGVQKVDDIRFSRSDSRAGFSRIIVRFHDLDDDAFDQRITDLRREVQNRADRMPAGAQAPDIVSINSDNASPAVLLLVVGQAYDDRLRRQATDVADSLERVSEINRVDRRALRTPELQVRFDPAELQGLGVSPATLSDTVRAYFRDRAVGSLTVGDREWLLRLSGTRDDPLYLEGLPLITDSGEVPLRSVARVLRGHAEPAERVAYQGRPAVLLQVYKNEGANLLALVDGVDRYVERHNATRAAEGAELVVLHDRTGVTRHALAVMEDNALVGLALVLAVTWLALGLRVALAATVGIPFALAATLAVAALLGETLNVVVLLGLVISLGMLVDDTVVVAEAIHERLRRGEAPLAAAIDGVREVGTAVVASVLTTLAAFLPLMLMPGVLGDFMSVAPLVVAVALLASLVEAFWILPSHIVAGAAFDRPTRGRAQPGRVAVTAWVRNRYARLLSRSLRHPWMLVAGLGAVLAAAVAVVQLGLMRVDYFATDSARLVYINVDMPSGTSLDKTLERTRAVEAAVRPHLQPGESRAIASYAGLQVAQADSVNSHNAGQVAISLRPRTDGGRSVAELIRALESAARDVPGIDNIAFRRVQTGPPTERPINVKLRGDDFDELARAATALKEMLAGTAGVRDVQDDDLARRMEMRLQLDADALVRTGLPPDTVTRVLQLLADGEVIASMRSRGETVDVRVRADRSVDANPLEGFLGAVVNLPGGGTTTLRQLVDTAVEPARSSIRHQDYRRAITVTAGIDKQVTDTLSVNGRIRAHWRDRFADRFPGVDLDFSGRMDDIEESLRTLARYFLVAALLIYLILATQFRSYFQPLIVLATVPIAFVGVILGVAASGQAFSLYTLYGAVALAGIAVNSAIVFVTAANRRRRSGMTVAQATVFAARRRVVPILITSLTTMAGLFALATGLAGESRIWGPVAAAIVCGLAVSTFLTLIVAPALYARFAPPRRRAIEAVPPPVPLGRSAGPLARLRAIISGEWGQRRRYAADRRAIAADRTLAAAYGKAREHLLAGDYLRALKLFQYVAEKKTDVALANRAAAHAALGVLQSLGGDSGYEARARRFLRRALRRAPEAPDLLALQRVYETLAAGPAVAGEAGPVRR